MQLVSKNNNGVFHTVTKTVGKKKKEVEELRWENCHIITDSGKVVSTDISPKFEGLKYEDYAKMAKTSREVLYLEPMSAHEDKHYVERNLMVSNEIAELKYDGHRGTLHIGKKHNRIFSRSISKETGWFTENSDQVPHIRDLSLPEFAGTVLDGEVDYGTTSMGVQSVMGAHPHTAVQYQYKNRFINLFAFDILYYKGINVQAMPLWKRKIYLMKVILAFYKEYQENPIRFAMIYVHPKSASSLMQKWSKHTDDITLAFLDRHLNLVDNFVDKFKEVVAMELEGLIVKDMNARYEQKRSKAFIKLKGASTWDCVFMGITEPTKEYEGKEIATWKFWEADGTLMQFDGQAEAVEHSDMSGETVIPVSKPYFMGWCGAIEFGVWKPIDHDELLAECGGNDGQAIAVINQLENEGRISEDEDGTLRELVKVGDCKGLTEKLQEELKLRWTDFLVMGRVLEVKANGIIDEKTGSLRHPRFSKWRLDKNSEDCVWSDHIRKL